MNINWTLSAGVAARSCGWVGERADSQLSTWWGDCGVCLYALEEGAAPLCVCHLCPLLSFNASLCVCVHLCLWMRPIDILHCDPLTPDNSNQWDEWEAKGGGGGCVCPQRSVCLWEDVCVCVWGGEGESSARTNVEKNFTRRGKKTPFSWASLFCIHAEELEKMKTWFAAGALTAAVMVLS